ncbi:CHRD domain-containing protein [Bacillus toyonensis]|uniref:CHRD domain-containing protein n=1 Tax=Bacillus toyonensis TaxID=155322 RepID=UPI0018A14B75|nr:CHRD domain-containing protein [Bacillus toyonensis]MBF7150766.1 CHRD domain-containing protein [Bacillus toyonensis]MEC2351727.1 CHRD domain-containing protein [Bacillus toyonensis]MED3189659.1 CHRD domain-containing protein [Bacillus toyonensis]
MTNFYFAELRGDNSVPPVITTAKGVALFGFNDNFTLLNFVLQVSDLSKYKVAHLRFGMQNSNRSIITILFEACTRSISVNLGTVSGIIMNSDLTGPLSGRTLAELSKQIELGHIYVNIISEQYRSGEISGKLIPVV